MNLDFILFTPPAVKRSLIDFWGEVVFIPVYQQSDNFRQKQSSFLDSFFNCYQPKKDCVIQLTVDRAYIEANGIPQIDSDSIRTQQSTQSSARSKVSLAKLKEQKITKPIGYLQPKQQKQKQSKKQVKKYLNIQRHIPCLFLNSMVRSKYLLLYLHASGEDIKLSQKLLDLIRNSYQINVLALEYPGYSIYPGKPSSDIIRKDAEEVFKYATQTLGFQEKHIIVVGRSIGTAVAIELCKHKKIAALALISPFISVKSLAHQFVGKIGHFLAQDTFNSHKQISYIQSPVFFLHGLQDQLISYENSVVLRNACKKQLKTALKTPKKMTHSSFDFYADFIDPLRQFLMDEIGLNFYEQNMNGPELPSQLFQFPEGWKYG